MSIKYTQDADGNIYGYDNNEAQQALAAERIAAGHVQINDLPVPPSPSPAALKAAALSRINGAYQLAVDALVSGYPDDEVKSWQKQEEEARAWLADNATPTPWIDAAATARGITKSLLVSKIIESADAFAPAHGLLTGKRQMLRDQIEALGDTPTQEQLDAIQW